MGERYSGGVVVDEQGLKRAVDSLSQSAATVRNTVGDVSNNLFGDGGPGAESEAGREYVAEGKKVHDALGRVVDWLAIWTTATENTARTIGKVSVEIVSVDVNNARKTNQV